MQSDLVVVFDEGIYDLARFFNGAGILDTERIALYCAMKALKLAVGLRIVRRGSIA